MSFLSNVARQIVNDHPNGCDDVLVVFNNRRAGLFLQREMQTLGDKPFFLPRIIGIDDLIRELGGLRIVPHEFLLFELFDIHTKKIGNSEPFEDFISLGEMMLADFSEIDLYMVDAKSLLGNLYDLKQLGEWNLDQKTLSDFQKRYLDFYNSLIFYYDELHRRLIDRNEAFAGMAYRKVAEQIESLIGKVEERFVYFVGFNALSNSESAIIKCFEQRNMGRLICDGDNYYFSDVNQEAGLFLRQNALRHSINTDFDSFFAKNEKVVHIVNCPENVLQAKTAATIINNSENPSWGSGSAIVLSDEKLLMPMLNSLPSSIDAINVTMGLPFSLTGIHNMVCKILSLYSNSRNNKFYHTDISNIFSDNIISRLIHNTNALSEISQSLYESKVIYASPEEISQLAKDVSGAEKIMFIFESEHDVPSLLATLRKLVESLTQSGCLDSVVREQEALASLLLILNYFDEILTRYSPICHLETLQRIYLRLAPHRSIALYGEPLKEMQLLGMLETRNLDFERLIILSVNEGTLPSGRSSNSLIPYTLKRAFGLPTHQEKDAVYAYNFYRLIQRADEVWLVYSSDAEGMGKGEPSRFILQLRDEMAPRLSNIKIVNHSAEVDNKTCANSSLKNASKNERTQQRLKDMASYGFSPSALNRYRNCPLQFFLGDVLGAHEQEELSEDVESNELGTFIHKLLCDIYSIDEDKRIRIETLQNALKKLPNAVDNLFMNEVLKGRSNEGKNRLYMEVSKMELCHFLEKEIEKLKNGHTIQMVLTDDKPISQPLIISQPYVDYPINIQGTTDRVDYYDGQLRIADYKSGGVNEYDLRLKSPIDSPRDPSDKWFQVMTYAWLYCRNHEYSGTFLSGIFPLRALNSDFIPASWDEHTVMDSSHIDRFERLLCDLISEILNPETDFSATPKKGACDFCPFRKSCI